MFWTLAVSLLIVGTLALGFAQGGVGAAAPASSAGHALPAVSPSEQRAFGGSVSSTFSCSNATCFGPEATPVDNLSLSWQYSVTWAVIYTVTNVSGSQTEIQIQAAVAASASIKISTCTGGSVSVPCYVTSFAVSLQGSESSNGYTNLTTGTVDQTNTSAGPTGSTPAWAIMNSWSKAALNFSGSFGAHLRTSTVTETESASFDFGGSETSSITFGTPLPIVPTSPVAGDGWNSSAAFTGSGSYTNGSSVSVSVNGSTAGARSHWTHGHISPSGTLNVSGTDVGPVTLYDNYTTPPTVVTAQVIDLTFSGANLTAQDGWLVVPINLFGGVGALSSDLLVGDNSPSPAALAQPVTTTLNGSSESADYHSGSGFIGAGAGGVETLPSSEPGELAPTVKVQTGPEPVSVAQGQYNSIVSPASTNSPFPLLLVVVAVVVVVVAIGGVFLWRRSAGRNRPPATPPPTG